MATARDGGGMRLLGLMTGMAFGSLLQRGRLSRQDVIIDQFALRDARVVKTMGTAVAVGAAGIHTLVAMGLTKKDVKPMKVGGVAGGAALFGTGLALLGYCPGTSLAALGEGRRDAMAGVIGMLCGASAFVRLYESLVPLIDAGGDFGKITVRSHRRERSQAEAPKSSGLRTISDAGTSLQ